MTETIKIEIEIPISLYNRLWKDYKEMESGRLNDEDCKDDSKYTFDYHIERELEAGLERYEYQDSVDDIFDSISEALKRRDRRRIL